MEAADSFVRFAQYAALLPLFGLSAFALYARRAWTELAPHRLVTALTVMAVLVSLTSLFTLTARMGGALASAFDRELLGTVVGGTQAGWAWLARVVALILALGFQHKPKPRFILTGFAAASLAWAGHAAADEGMPGAIRLAGDMLHLLAAGAWIGAIAAFLSLAFSRGAARTVTVEALSAFANTGTGLVTVLVLTGLYNTARSFSWKSGPVLIFDAWTAILAVKLVLVGAMLVLAAANRFWLTPRFADDEAGRGHLRISLVAELLVGLAVLAVVAVLGLTPPPAAA